MRSKRIFGISGIIFIFFMIILVIFLQTLRKETFRKNYYIAVVTVQGQNKPEVNFMDHSLKNIGKINLDAKDFLRIFNYNRVEKDKDAFYFVQDSSIFSNNNNLLKVDKNNFKQTEVKLDNYPSYFYVGKDNIYTVEILLHSSNLGIFDKAKNSSIKKEKINKELSPSVFEYNSDLYYYINDKNKVTLYNYTKKKSELSIEGINGVLYTCLVGEDAYILGKFTENNEKGNISKYLLVKYNFKTKKKYEYVIPNKENKYAFADLIVINGKVILQEDVNLVSFKNKKEVLYIDLDKNKIKSILVDEYPQSINVDKSNNIIFVSKNSISIYDKNFKLTKRKKINTINKNDYEKRFNSYVLIGRDYEKK